jgi:hypothetical protein
VRRIANLDSHYPAFNELDMIYKYRYEQPDMLFGNVKFNA